LLSCQRSIASLDLHRLSALDRDRALRNFGRKTATGKVFHDDVGRIAEGAGAVDDDQVGMNHASGGLGLAPETGE
jgi:hypothetical protein